MFGSLISLGAAVTVTTPGKLAEEDVVKGNNMFNNLGVPTVAAVENMAYFECGGLEEGEVSERAKLHFRSYIHS